MCSIPDANALNRLQTKEILKRALETNLPATWAVYLCLRDCAMTSFQDPEIYKDVLRTLSTGVYLVDREGRIVFWNQGAEEITGYLSQEVLGRQCGDSFLGHVDRENRVLSGAEVPLVAAMRDGQTVEARLSIRHKIGHPVLLRLRASPIRDVNGTVVGAAECFDEPAASLQHDNRESKLAMLGCIDGPTGAANRDYTETQIEEHLRTFALHRVPFSILAVEVDNLDALRARDGNGVVHTLLRVTAEALASSLRPTDLLGRWTETQFLALVTECSSFEIHRVAERLQKMVSCAEARWWGDPLQFTASFGGTSAKDGDCAEDLVKRAQTALQESVSQGGNRVLIHHD